MLYDFKRLGEVANSTTNVRSDLDKVANYLAPLGFKFLGDETTEHTDRYVKRGFYDGDFPNAHQSIKTTKSKSFEYKEKLTDAGASVLAEKLTGDLKKLGFRSYYSKFMSWPDRGGRRFSWKAYKGKSSIALIWHTTKKGNVPKFSVSMSTERSRPDTVFERSGRGIGQII